MLYVKCKNPECGGEIKAPFPVRVQSAFSRVVNADITCPYCRVTTAYAGADFHQRAPVAPSPMPARSGAPANPPSAPGGGAMPR